MIIATTSAVALDLVARYWLRKRLRKARALGGFMRRIVAAGHPKDVEALISELLRELTMACP